MCRSELGNKKILQAFQDNIDKEVNRAGPIFCEPLNGKLIDFPDTIEKFQEINAFKMSTMKIKNFNEMSITVNAKSFAAVGKKPYIERFQDLSLDLMDIKTSAAINASKDVLNFISGDQQAYQTEEELCYIMTTTADENFTETVNSSIFTNKMCNRFGDWWTLCEFEKPVFIYLSGLCNNSPIDKIYSLIEPKEDTVDRLGTFAGTTGWVVGYNETLETWTVSHYAFVDDGVIMLDQSRRPFGKKTWLVSNYECNQGEDTKLQLLISSCNDDQFTCNDGTCIHLQKRCDKKLDCKDLSDERECKIVALDEERYLKDDTPPPLKPGDKQEVTLSLEIQNILNIREVQKIISLKFKLEQIWMDARLQYYNLKEDEELNTLMASEKQEIWVPSILFSNTRQDFASKNDEQTFAKVIRSKNGSLISSETNEDILVYKGSENEIRMYRIYEIDFLCDYQMHYYPFDVQLCTMDLIIDGNTAKFIDLLPGNLTYSGSVDMAQYYIMSHDIFTSEIKGKNGVKVSITLGRRLLGTILTVYTPTVLLNIIGHASNYFKDFFFEAVVTVNLTCMLVLVTLFINVSEGLPKTSYLKMMDFWLIFNLILPFVEVLLHTYMESLNEDHTTQAKKKEKKEGEVYNKDKATN